MQLNASVMQVPEQALITLCPSDAGPHWPGGYNVVGKGMVLSHAHGSMEQLTGFFLVPCRFRVPWASSDLCPFNTGSHWLGGYNEVSTGVSPSLVVSANGICSWRSGVRATALARACFSLLGV